LLGILINTKWIKNKAVHLQSNIR